MMAAAEEIYSLPLLKEASKALNTIQKDCETWRNIVIQSINYGITTTGTKDDDSKDPKPDGNTATSDTAIRDERVRETAIYLLTLLNDLSSKTDDDVEMDSGNTSPSPENISSIDLAENILTDALWLMGAMLEPQTKKASTGTENDSGDSTNVQTDDESQYAALCKLTYELTKPQSIPCKGNNLQKNRELAPISNRTAIVTLEPQLLNASQILSDKALELFFKKIRKLNTDMYYRQKKVNLMQEESEGYAKFVRFLINLPQALMKDADLITKRNVPKHDYHKDIIELAKLRLAEFIGTFDLDPNRCLDLALDVLESEIRQAMHKHRGVELVKLIRNAPEHAMTVRLLLHIIQLFPVDSVTHLMGFKFAAYQKNIEKNGTNGELKNQNNPKSLFVTTGILASNGVLSLPILGPHLTALTQIETDYDAWKQASQKKIKKMGVISLNASKKTTDKAEDANGKFDVEKHQVIELFHLLLEIGLGLDFSMGLFNFGVGNDDAQNRKKAKETLVKCCCLYPPLGKILCNMLERSIEPLYSAKVDNVGTRLKNAENEDGEVSKADKNFSLLSMESREHRDVEFGLSISLVEFFNAIEVIIEPIIMSGSMAGSATLYVKLCRLAHAMLVETKSKSTQIHEVDEKALVFLDRVLVSTLSLFPFNPAISSELWSVLNILPYQTRYALYASWRKYGLGKAALRSPIQPQKPLALVESEVNTEIKTKYLLKRMSKDNIRDMGRQVSKVSHNNPLVVFTLILNQIESYDNLILMMVETFKFMGVLSLDVMGYCLLVSLGGEGEGRSKLKDDGVNAAQWLSSLETFTGAFYKRFTDVELKGLLAYFMRRLHDGQTLELGVLQSLIKMAGGYGFIDSGSSASLSQVQLDGRCGSLTLRKETSDFGIVEKFNIRSSRRLRSSLQDDACGITFLIILCQLRTKVLFDESRDRPKEIKLIGNIYDTCHKTLNTILAFLTDGSQDVRDGQNLGAIATYAKFLPTLGELNKKYGIVAADAWALCRPLVRAALFAEEDLAENKDAKIPEHLQPFHPASTVMESSYHDMLPEENWKHISPLLFRRFYSYAIYDLTYPEERYQSEIARIKREIDRLTMLQKGGRDAIGIQASMASAAAAAGGTQQDIRNATAFTKEHAAELDRFRLTAEMLSFEMKRQKKHFEHVKDLFVSEKEALFASTSGEIGSFFTTCLYPRALSSPEDAMYCARFITQLHDMETPGFSTLKLLDVIVSAVVGALYSVTEDEAGCFGIFLNELWKVISRWRYNEEMYENEVHGKPGGIWNISTSENKIIPSKASALKHSDYVVVYNTWHAGLGLAFIGSLKSTEYMHLRTALIILTKIVDFFPTKSTLGEKLLEALVPLQEDSNPMQDIKAMAQGYSSKIIKARDTGTWKEEDSGAMKAREEKEKKLQEDRKKNAEKQLEEMEKEMADSSKQLSDSRHDRNPKERRPQPRFTAPPATSKTVLEKAPQSHGRSQEYRGHRDDRGGRRDDPRSSDRGSGPQDRWERNGPDGARGLKRGRSPDKGRGAPERGRGGDERGRGGDRDRERGDAKRSRSDRSPPRRPPRRGGNRRRD